MWFILHCILVTIISEILCKLLNASFLNFIFVENNTSIIDTSVNDMHKNDSSPFQTLVGIFYGTKVPINIINSFVFLVVVSKNGITANFITSNT